MDTELRVERVAKSYGATRALIDVSLSFRPGEVHCLLGENGAGKSTLGKIIGGLVQPDTGALSWRGAPLVLPTARAARAAGIAIVHQELSLARDLTVRENLWLGSEGARFLLRPVKRRFERERATAVLAGLGVTIDLDARVGSLPVAVQQLVEIGKALMGDPRLVVFDEPTAMLGAVEKQKLFAVLRKLRADGVVIVLVTHHIEDVMEIGDHVSVMRNGAIVDSFAKTGDLGANDVLERLTGRKRQPLVTHHVIRSDAPSLEVRNVAARDGAPLDIAVRGGEIVGFYGVVGCGAEALVQGLVGEASSPADYRVAGRSFRPSTAAQARAAGIAYLPAGRASHCILPSRSILENTSIGMLGRLGRYGVIARKGERDEVVRMLGECGVKYASVDDPITSLSGGNQQKVLIARAIGAARTALVLEEPTAGVDIDAKDQIHRLVDAAAARGIAVVLLSSDLAESIALCDVLYTLYAGQVVGVYRNPSAADEAAILFDVLGRRDGETVAEAGHTAQC